ERTSEVTQLKKDVGAQKKKAFATAEEIKTLKADLKSAKENAKAAASARPAFADEPEKKPEAPSPQAAAKPAAPDLSGKVQELEERIASLETAKAELQAKNNKSEGELKKMRGEVRKAKRRVDDYRRADQVGRSRSELTDDKVRHLSRQYYEVVSELAALKGEVAPPPPREIDEVRRDAAEVENAPVRTPVTEEPQSASPADAPEVSAAAADSATPAAEEATRA
ncbi:MAG: hypothetical protein AAFY60_04545, partial [Myxococcota bacterium]